jgi:hypothetical protein
VTRDARGETGEIFHLPAGFGSPPLGRRVDYPDLRVGTEQALAST